MAELTATVHVKIVGTGNKINLKILAVIAKILCIKLEVKEDVGE